MNLFDLLEFVKTHNLPLDVELGFICENQWGTGSQFTILEDYQGNKTVCLDEV